MQPPREGFFGVSLGLFLGASFGEVLTRLESRRREGSDEFRGDPSVARACVGMTVQRETAMGKKDTRGGGIGCRALRLLREESLAGMQILAGTPPRVWAFAWNFDVTASARTESV